jgi:hypothetical protein
MEDMGDASLIGWHTWRQGEVKSLSSQSFARGLEGQYGRAERQSNETGDRSAKLRMYYTRKEPRKRCAYRMADEPDCGVRVHVSDIVV